jgi:hypothetical protein
MRTLPNIFSVFDVTVIFRPDVDDVYFVLDQHAKLDFHSSVKQEMENTNALSDFLFWFTSINSCVTIFSQYKS